MPVRKTYKLFIGGAFPRSESGRLGWKEFLMYEDDYGPWDD
jgi:hypothetical protein